MTCFLLTMNKFGKVREVFNDGVDWMLPKFQAIKEINVAFATNKMLQDCVGKVGVFKITDAVGISIHCGYADEMVLNKTIDVFPSIPRGG